MKKHFLTIFLLVLATVAFVLYFCVDKENQIYFNIVSFLSPTIAALIEVTLAIWTDKENELRDQKLESHDKLHHWRKLTKE